MTDLDKIRAWSHQRQFLGRRSSMMSVVMKTIVGVYSAHPTGPLSMFARLKKLPASKFFTLDADRQVLRVPCMRESVYMLPAATAQRVVAATLPARDDPYWAKRYSVPGRKIPPSKYENWRTKIVKCSMTSFLNRDFHEP